MDPKAIVRDGYDNVSYAYRADDASAAPPHYAAALAQLEQRLRAGSNVLDLGCGCGIPVAHELARRHQVTGVDLSPVQIERARRLTPSATFLCADMTAISFQPETFDAVIALYSIIHVPLAEQPGLFARLGRWLKPGGWLLASVGHSAWTGTETDWCGVPGATMYWSHGDAATYRRWLEEAGLPPIEEEFLPEGAGGHTLMLCRKETMDPS